MPIFKLQFVGRKERPFGLFGLRYAGTLGLVLCVSAVGDLEMLETQELLIWRPRLGLALCAPGSAFRAVSDAGIKYILCAIALYLCALFGAGWPQFATQISTIPPME
jgi:hypothetical protein